MKVGKVTRVMKIITQLQSFCTTSWCLFSSNLSNYLCNKVSIASSVLMKPWIVGISYCVSAFSCCSQVNKQRLKKKHLIWGVNKKHIAESLNVYILLWWVICNGYFGSRKTATWLELCMELIPFDFWACGTATVKN